MTFLAHFLTKVAEIETETAAPHTSNAKRPSYLSLHSKKIDVPGLDAVEDLTSALNSMWMEGSSRSSMGVKLCHIGREPS